jgi:hypothetical protein
LKSSPSAFEAEKKIRQQEAQDQGKGVGDKDHIKRISYGFTEIDIGGNYFDVVLKTDKIFFVDPRPVGQADEEGIKNGVDAKDDKADEKGGKEKNGPKNLVLPVDRISYGSGFMHCTLPG